ncbi:MAG: diguanylate cyclase [Candidatus Tectimicrobiota bacterium]
MTAIARLQIIDADVSCCEALAAHLRTCGYSVDIYSDLEEGLQQAEKVGFDLILVEHQWPAASGQHVLPRLQACPGNPCILLMSQEPSTTLVRHALTEGAFDFLIKPLEPAQIEKSVAAGLENRKAFLAIYHLSQDLQEANQQLQEANQQLSTQKHLLEEERDQLKAWARELNMLNEFSSAICSTLDTQAIITLVTSELSTLIHYDLCTLILFTDPQVQMYFHTPVPVAHRLVEKIVEDFIAASPRLLGRQVSTSEVTYAVEGSMGFGEYPYDTNFFTTSPLHAVANLVVAREIIGLIGLYRFAHEPFSAGQTRLLSTLANQVALALRNAREYRKTQEMALRDGLTRLYNHAAFQDFLDREFEAFRRYSRPLSLLIFDIDHFKAINDTYGHQTGDYILKELAALSQGSVRKTDLLARYGGEEFALVLPDTDLQRAQILAERIWRKVQEHHFVHGDTILHITISLGLASAGTLHVANKEELIRSADAALYRAKHAGRNHVYVAHGEQQFYCPHDTSEHAYTLTPPPCEAERHFSVQGTTIS